MKKIIVITLATLIALPVFSQAQYFEKLYDNDTTQDWGWCIRNRPDSSYFIVGSSFYETTEQFSAFDMTISSDGSLVLSKKNFVKNGGYIGPGNPGEMIQLSNGYVLPLNKQWPNPTASHVYSAAGIMKFDAAGDTVFLKTFTDTSVYFDALYAINLMLDGGYIAGGVHAVNSASVYPGYIIRTDSMGDTLWTHTYQKDTAQWVTVNTVIPLSDGRIVVGAMSAYNAWDGSTNYFHNTPWFLVLDSMGNILKDTLYGSDFAGGGAIYKDKNGGYIHIGNFDSLYTSNASDIENFPSYIAHLDTNFRITWITSFSYTPQGHRDKVIVRQLRDSSYVVVGISLTNYLPNAFGWASKVDRNGNILWDQYYESDTLHENYFRDMVEMPNGDLVFTGASYNDTLPSWHTVLDVWIVGTDSNGCVMEGCLTTKVTSPQLGRISESVTVYPNPASTVLNFQYSQQTSVTIKITDVTGRLMDKQVLQNSSAISFDVSMYAPGIYLYQFITDSGVQSGKVIME